MSNVVSNVPDEVALRLRQSERETEMVQKGIERYRKDQLAHAEAGQHGLTQVGRGFLGRIMEKLTPAVEKLQEDALNYLASKGKDHHKWVVFLSLDAERLAFITACSVFSFRSFRKEEDEDEDDSTQHAGVIAGFRPVILLVVATDMGRQVIQERIFDVRCDERRQVHLLREAKEKEATGEIFQAQQKLERVVEIGGQVRPEEEQRFINAKQAQSELQKLEHYHVAIYPKREVKKPRTIDVTKKVQEQLEKSTSSLTKKEKLNRLEVIRKVETSLHHLDLRSLGTTGKGFTGQQLVSVGGELVELLIQTCPDWFEMISVAEAGRAGKNNSPKKANHIALRPSMVDCLKEEHALRELERPWRTPMVCRPTPWTYNTIRCNYIGGYLDKHLPLISHQQRRRHTADESDPVSPIALKAINAIQSTPWRINQRVLETMTEFLERSEGKRLGLPVRLSDDDEVDEKGWKTKRRTIEQTRDAASELRTENAFWFPHYMDFRGRIYPYPQDLHPQLGDAPRALLEFAQGKPLGGNGREYLASHIAGLYSSTVGDFREEKVRWVEDHTGMIRSLAQNPLKEIDFWCKAGDLWRFLAGCMEWNRLHEQGPDLFRSHIPILMDGTCNGLQHLAALTGESQLGQSVNLTSGPRRDIYQEVANTVTQWMGKEESGPEIKWARIWLELGLTRETMKPCVMPIPYGISQKGIAEALIEKKPLELPPDDLTKASWYLATGVWQHVKISAGQALKVMNWLKKLATKLAKAKIPLIWTTPVGSRVRMAYFTTVSHIVKLSSRNHKQSTREIRVHEQTKELDAKKQGKGAAPNFVHSLDAAHLIKTVDACVDAGIQDFMMIHDAYGVHACDASDLARILREQFVQMYQDDWLDLLWSESVARYPALSKQMDGPPTRTDFDFSQVLDSEFFFQ